MSAIIKYIRYIPKSEHNASFIKLGVTLLMTGSSLIAFDCTSCFCCSEGLDTFSESSP